MARIIEAKISKSALRHNMLRVREVAPYKKILAMIKANGYGHGAITVANTLAQEVDAFGVACIETAVYLRDEGIKNAILLVEGCFDFDEQVLVQIYGLSQVLHSFYQVEQLKKYKREIKKPFEVWVKINTGMNRLGFSCDEAKNVLQILRDMKHVHVVGCMTHFPVADQLQHPLTKKQQEKFYDTLKGFSLPVSLANSAAILAWPTAHGDWVRPGLILYGASPFSGKLGKDYNLKPVMTLQAKLIAIREVKKGEIVGYGAEWICDKPKAKIGIVGIGYGDGYPWHAKNGTPVHINGKNVPLVGRVSMDMIAIDLGEVPNCQIQDTVTLWGENLPVELVAQHSSTIPYELFCRLTARVNMLGVE